VYAALSCKYMSPQATGVLGLKILVCEALSYQSSIVCSYSDTPAPSPPPCAAPASAASAPAGLRTLQVLSSLTLLIQKYKYWQARQVLHELLERRTREALRV
jgi:hypothetical protein